MARRRGISKEAALARGKKAAATRAVNKAQRASQADPPERSLAERIADLEVQLGSLREIVARLVIIVG